MIARAKQTLAAMEMELDSFLNSGPLTQSRLELLEKAADAYGELKKLVDEQDDLKESLAWLREEIGYAENNPKFKSGVNRDNLRKAKKFLAGAQ
jgi:hypothetical protein